MEIRYEEINSKITRKGKDNYIWNDDGIKAPVRDMTVLDLSPSFRIGNGYVEIPQNWKERMVFDKDSIPFIDALIEQHGRRNIIFAEEGGSRVKTGVFDLELPVTMDGKEIGKMTEPYTIYSNSKYTNGWLVPLAEWDHAMSRVIGIIWEMDDSVMAELLASHK